MQHGVLLVAEQDGEIAGMLFGIVSGLWFAPRTLWASELAWWVEPAARGGTAGIRLVTAFQDWAREQGAKVVAMSSLHLDHDNRVSNVLQRMGFSPSEHTYIKRIA
jgi:GNAT superfamily N-acetyltransferase